MRPSSNVCVTLMVFGFLLTCRTAGAQEQAPPEPQTSAPAPPESTSYGAQVVLADLGGILVGVLASQVSHDAVPLLATWSLASPVVHLVHGHPSRALLSVLLHVGMPIVGGYIGFQAESCRLGSEDEICGFAGLALGGLVGMVAATTIDAAVLAQLPDEHQPPPAAYGRGIASSPALSVNPRGDVTVGWRGTF